MARRPRKPQVGSETASSTSEPSTQAPKGVYERLKESRTFYEAIVVALVAAVIGILWDRWTDEIGQHQKTMSRLERAEASERDAVADRDRLQKDLTDFRKENADLKKLHSILEFYGPRAKYTASYDLRKEANARLGIGKCLGASCIVLTLLEMTTNAKGLPAAILELSGRLVGTSTIQVVQSIRRGCKSDFEVGPYRITFVIEEDRVHDIRVGVGISVGTFREGLYVESQEKCPET